jgi:hypothetical protein
MSAGYAAVFNFAMTLLSIVAFSGLAILEKYRLVEFEELVLPDTTLAKAGLVLYYGAQMLYALYQGSRYFVVAFINSFTFLNIDVYPAKETKRESSVVVQEYYDNSRFGNPIGWTGAYISAIYAGADEETQENLVVKVGNNTYTAVSAEAASKKSRSRSSSRSRV